jgi:hypothetical protein
LHRGNRPSVVCGLVGSGVAGRSGEAAAAGAGLGSSLRWVGTSSEDEIWDTTLPAAEYDDSDR